MQDLIFNYSETQITQDGEPVALLSKATEKQMRAITHKVDEFVEEELQNGAKSYKVQNPGKYQLDYGMVIIRTFDENGDFLSGTSFLLKDFPK